jgi:hypothetical protein
MTENIRWQVYIVFGVFNLCMLVHAALLFPETAGKTLEEVAAMFEDPHGIPYIGTPPWRTRVQFHRARALESGRDGGEDEKKDQLVEESPGWEERVEEKV